MLRVAGRRLSSQPWKSSAGFLSGNNPFNLNGGVDDSHSLSRSVHSPLPFSFTSQFPHLIRGVFLRFLLPLFIGIVTGLIPFYVVFD